MTNAKASTVSIIDEHDEFRGSISADNFAVTATPPPDVDETKVTEEEKLHMERRGKKFYTTGFSYASEHGTRAATIGFVLASNPLAHLAWWVAMPTTSLQLTEFLADKDTTYRIGEKFIEWTDETPPLKKILDSITLYWFTESFPRCIYTYREVNPVASALLDR